MHYCSFLDHRFNGSLIARLLVPYLPVCVLYCLNNECCRSVNVLKAKGMDKENCELLSVVAEDHPEFLIDDRDYTYSILTQPIRVSNQP